MQDGRSAEAGPTRDATAPEPERVHLHMPIDVRSASLAVIAVLASIYALHWASAVFIPLLLGVMFSYVLSPAVNWLQRSAICGKRRRSTRPRRGRSSCWATSTPRWDDTGAPSRSIAAT